MVIGKRTFNYALPLQGDSRIRIVQVNSDRMMTISGPDKMTGCRLPIAQPHRDCTNVTARNSHAAWSRCRSATTISTSQPTATTHYTCSFHMETTLLDTTTDRFRCSTFFDRSDKKVSREVRMMIFSSVPVGILKLFVNTSIIICSNLIWFYQIKPTTNCCCVYIVEYIISICSLIVVMFAKYPKLCGDFLT